MLYVIFGSLLLGFLVTCFAAWFVPRQLAERELGSLQVLILIFAYLLLEIGESYAASWVFMILAVSSSEQAGVDLAPIWAVIFGPPVIFIAMPAALCVIAVRPQWFRPFGAPAMAIVAVLGMLGLARSGVNILLIVGAAAQMGALWWTYLRLAMAITQRVVSPSGIIHNRP